VRGRQKEGKEEEVRRVGDKNELLGRARRVG
jgi:hypothetical protein